MIYLITEIVLGVALLSCAAALWSWAGARAERRLALRSTAVLVVLLALLQLAAPFEVPELLRAALALLALAAAAASAVLLWKAHGPGVEVESRAEVPATEPEAPAVTQDEPLPVEQQDRLAEFVYVVSHDLQEPLRMVIGFGQLLERRYADRLDDQGREFLKMSTSSAARMSNMLSDLLRLSRIEQAEIPDEPVALERVLETAQMRQRQLIAESGAKVLADALPEVAGNATLLTDVFQELLANSIKYRSDEAPLIYIRQRVEDGFHHIVVEDNGIGFEQRFAERVFKPFQRLHPVDAYSGTGMGLAIVKHIMERHGGSVMTESTPGKGARFTLRLPVAPHAAAA